MNSSEPIVIPVHEGEPNPLGIPEYNITKSDDSLEVIEAKTKAQEKAYEEYKNSMD